MLPETLVHDMLTLGQSLGADFVEVFAEESRAQSMDLVDRKIDAITSGISFGVGVRLVYGLDVRYGYSSDPAQDTLLGVVRNLARNQALNPPQNTVGQSTMGQNTGGQNIAAKGGQEPQGLAFTRQAITNRHPVAQDPEAVPLEARVEWLRRADASARAEVDSVRQVSASISEKRRQILIANSEGLWVEDTRRHTRVRLGVIADTGSGPQSAGESPGVLGGWEFITGLDVDAMARDVARRAHVMAGAGYITGGAMPVILGNGFGGVIFHEACGHPLETEAIRKNASPFVGKLGQAVAQSVLTAVDDGTIGGAWGSCNLDDEGAPTQRTVLIENGILKNYLADRLGAQQTGFPRTGSGRRESYKYAPVSRMRNTFIAPGPNTLDDMFAGVENGLYAKKMGGGSVDPATGEFNFAVQEGFVIRGGKLAEPVRGATLIGKGHEVLPLISMVGSDFELAAGMCGAASGWVPTTVGQPSLKIDRILVGGR